MPDGRASSSQVRHSPNASWRFVAGWIASGGKVRGGVVASIYWAIDVEKTADGDKPLPFDLTRAHELYQELFGQVGDLIGDKHLLIVPSGPLTQLPFHVLVTEQPDPAATGTDAFRRAAWLAKSNSITVLPSVSSLKALREHAKTSHATKPFVGFGNPLLDGPDS